MELSQEAIRLILGIKKSVPLTSEEMAKDLKVTFFPLPEGTNNNLITFGDKLKLALKELGVEVIPYEQALVSIREAGIKVKYLLIFMKKHFPYLLRNRIILKITVFFDDLIHILQLILNRCVPERLLKTFDIYKIRKGIVIIALGENKAGNLPIDNTYSFTHNPIVTIIDEPEELKDDLSYEEYMEIGLKLFTWHMSNIIITVGSDNWKIFSFNGYSLTYKLYEDFNARILKDLVPKIATRVSPPRITEFKLEISQRDFLDDPQLFPYVKDLVDSGPLLEKTKLFLPMKRIDTLLFRNDFYKWIASLHLDERNGMSYGFIARQLPAKLIKLVPIEEAKKELGIYTLGEKDFLVKGNKNYVFIQVGREIYCLEVPPVWVLMSRSGSQKTNLNPRKDIIKIGLDNGQMTMVVPSGIRLEEDYKPSFDTRVILSHCVANVIYASVLAHFNKDALFPKILEENGLALVHWHGTISPEFLPKGRYIYGSENPPVLCSSLQAAIYAFAGKGSAIKQSLSSNIEYLGDVHIEPQHGVNITWDTVKGLANFLLSRPSASELNSK